MNDGFLGIVRLGLTALQYLAFAVLVGALLSDRWLSRTPSGWQAALSRRLSVAVRVSALLALTSGVLAFWVHCALMSDAALPDAWPAVRSMLEETDYGRYCAISLGLLAGITAIAHMSTSATRVRLQRILWLLIGGFALARSHMGHPVDAGKLSMPVWADWIHLLAMSAWVGMVWAAAFIVAPKMRDAMQADHDNTAAFVQSLSDAATLALVALFATGAYNGWRGIRVPDNLFDSLYGQVLLLKLALVGLAAALGGHNRFFEMPHLLASLRSASPTSPMRPLKRFATVLHIESWVLAGVLLAAAVLASSPLPGTS